MNRLIAVVFILLYSFYPVSAQAADLKLVVLGDSLSAGYQLPPDAGFTTQLQKALDSRGHSVEVVNAGVSGDTTSGGLSRLDWSVAPDTDAVIVELGANDALRGISPEITRKNIEEITARLRERGIEVMLAGMLAPEILARNTPMSSTRSTRRLPRPMEPCCTRSFWKASH